jgi:hypothetical protein
MSGPCPKVAGRAEREEIFAIASLQNRSYFLATDKCELEFVFIVDWLLIYKRGNQKTESIAVGKEWV